MPNPNPYRPFGKSLPFALELVLAYTDGTEEQIHADESFRTAPHPVVQSNVYGSETIDNALRQVDWNTADFDDTEWKAAQPVAAEDEPKGELIEQFQPAIKVIHSYEVNIPQGITRV